MQTTEIYKSTLNSFELEAALPTLTAKLRDLQSNLSTEDSAVFASIINSAAKHLSQIQESPDFSDTEKNAYVKSISAQATIGMRAHILDLPTSLNLH